MTAPTTPTHDTVRTAARDEISADSCDVVVVGAGIAGLTAAERLVAAGLDVRVLEARDRVGGRTECGRFASGTAIELGGQWVGPTQDEVLALVERLGLETFTVHDEGVSLLFANGERSLGHDETFGLGSESARAFASLVEHIDRIASGIDRDAPWDSAEARVLDRMTAAQWLEENCDDSAARDFAATMLTTIVAAEAHEYSALHMLFYLSSGGGLHRMMLTIGGAQEARVRGGTHQLSEGLARQLGQRVLLDEEVLRVDGWGYHSAEDGTSITVTTTRRTLTCRRIVIALPPTMATRVS